MDDPGVAGGVAALCAQQSAERKNVMGTGHCFAQTVRASSQMALLLLLLFVIGCAHPNKRFPIEGQVLSRNDSAGEITLTHPAVPSLMPAMTMPVAIHDAAMLQQLQTGDKIAAELVVGKDPKDYWLENVRITGKAGQGARLYHENCAECHDNPQPDLHKQPPNLHGLFVTGSLPSGAPATDAQLHKIIVEGVGTMPAFDQRISEADVSELVKYLHHLQ
jgi:mono/diheme cytochrome c family protein